MMMMGSIAIQRGTGGKSEMKGGLGVSMEMVEMSKVSSGLCANEFNVESSVFMWVILSKTTFIQILNYLDEV